MPIHSSLRLEWFDRLDNLCDLSGTKMTDELEAEIERLFGRDFLRVVENYSEYTPDRLSSEQKTAFAKVFPPQFLLHAKYLFTLTCEPEELPLRMIFADINNTPVADPTNVDDWNTFYGTTFTSVVVDGNQVDLFGGVDVVIPPALFQNNDQLLAIIDLALCVIEISASAFNAAPNLAIALFEACLIIGDSAFVDCFSLSSGTFNACTRTGASSFANTVALTNPEFDSLETIGDSAFSLSGIVSCNFDTVISMGASAFAATASFTDPSFPNCTSMGDSAFNAAGCVTATFPILPIVPDNAFGSCVSLTTYDFGLTESIGDNAYKDCTSLPIISFPLCEDAGTSAFQNCTSAISIEMPSLITAGDLAFATCSSATSFNAPVLETIGDSCIVEMDSLITLSLPSLLTGGDDCLSNNNLLETVSIPACTDLSTGEFQNCPALTSLDIESLIAISGVQSFTNTGANFTFINMPTITDLSGQEAVTLTVGQTITVNVNVILETIDGGSPAGWIVTLEATNTATVNYIP